MPLVSAIRFADADNTRALANLAIATAWSGVPVYVGAGRQRWDIVLTAVQQGTISFLSGTDQTSVLGSTPGVLVGDTTVQSWNVPAGTAAFLFPWGFPPGATWAKAYYLQGAVAGNVAIAATLDPRAVPEEPPILRQFITQGIALVVYPTPPGAKTITVRLSRQAGLGTPVNTDHMWGTAGGVRQAAAFAPCTAADNVKVPIPAVTDDGVTPPEGLIVNSAFADLRGWLFWYP